MERDRHRERGWRGEKSDKKKKKSLTLRLGVANNFENSNSGFKLGFGQNPQLYYRKKCSSKKQK